MLSFVVVAARGKDLVELLMVWIRSRDGDLIPTGVLSLERAEDTKSVATPEAAEMLSRAICVTGLAFDILGHVPPYQL